MVHEFQEELNFQPTVHTFRTLLLLFVSCLFGSNRSHDNRTKRKMLLSRYLQGLDSVDISMGQREYILANLVLMRIQKNRDRGSVKNSSAI